MLPAYSPVTFYPWFQWFSNQVIFVIVVSLTQKEPPSSALRQQEKIPILVFFKCCPTFGNTKRVVKNIHGLQVTLTCRPTVSFWIKCFIFLRRRWVLSWILRSLMAYADEFRDLFCPIDCCYFFFQSGYRKQAYSITNATFIYLLILDLFCVKAIGVSFLMFHAYFPFLSFCFLSF